MKWTVLVSEEAARDIEEALYYDMDVKCCYDDQHPEKTYCGRILKVYRNARNDIYGSPAAVLAKGTIIDYLKLCKFADKTKIVRGWPKDIFRERPYV